jgi:hypothetical protein
MLNKLVVSFALVGLAIASAAQHRITLYEESVVNGTTLKPGDYKLVIEGDKATLSRREAESGSTCGSAEIRRQILRHVCPLRQRQRRSESTGNSRRRDGYQDCLRLRVQRGRRRTVNKFWVARLGGATSGPPMSYPWRRRRLSPPF